MRKTMIGAATVIMVMIGVWVWGCQEQQTPDMRTARLIAIENKELKAQMQAETKKRDDEIQKLKEQIQADIKKHNSEIQSMSDLLSQCEHDRTVGLKEQEKLQKEQIEKVLTGVMQENQKLTAEIERLNAEIAKLKGQ
jgi:cell division protein FtsB